jgi:hypothetical protein
MRLSRQKPQPFAFEDAACTAYTAGGIGGGGVFVPLLMLVVGLGGKWVGEWDLFGEGRGEGCCSVATTTFRPANAMRPCPRPLLFTNCSPTRLAHSVVYLKTITSALIHIHECVD